MRLTKFLCALAAYCCAISDGAAAPQSNSAGDIGKTPDYADELNLRANERFGSDAPGCVVSVIRNGRQEFLGAYGLADVEAGTPLQPASRMAIASVSKQFTAFAILLLHQEGEIDLSAPIASYLDRLPGWGQEVTVADLLHHQSGVRDYIQLQELRGLRAADYYSADELYRLISGTQLEFQPGARASYSNSGYFLLGRIVERVSGMSLRDFMLRRIFEPLGMTDTFLQDDMDENFERRAFGHTVDGGGAFIRDPSTIEIVGDGGVVTTAHDLMLWDRNFYDNRLGGGAALIDLMTSASSLPTGESTPHAAGLFVRKYRGQVRIGHTGNYGGFKASVQRFPDLHATIALFCNSDQISPVAEERWIAELALGDLLEPQASPTPPKDSTANSPPSALRRRIREGVYYSDELDVSWSVRKTGDGYEARLPSGVAFVLDPAGPDRLSMRDGWFEVILNGHSSFDLTYDSTRPIVFKRVWGSESRVRLP